MNLKSVKNYALVIFVAFGCLLLFTLIAVIQKSNSKICATKECAKLSKFFRQFLNNSQKASACENFYSFVCDGFLRKSFPSELVKNQELLEGFVKNDVDEETDSQLVRLQKKYFHACMDDAQPADDNNLLSLKRLYKSLGGWPILHPGYSYDGFEWIDFMILCRNMGVVYEWFLDFTFKDGVLVINVPNIPHKINETQKLDYTDVLMSVVHRFGAPKDAKTIEEVKKLVDFEMQLQKIIILNNMQQSTYTNVRNLGDLNPKHSWKNVVQQITKSWIVNLDFRVSNYMQQLFNLLKVVSKRTQLNYIFWRLTQTYAPFLNKNLRKLFNQLQLNSSIINREQYCYDRTVSSFQFVSEAEFVRQYQDNREEIILLYLQLKNIMKKHLMLSEWMDDESKTNAVSKLEKIHVIIGAPDEMYDEQKFAKILELDQVALNSSDIISFERELFNNSMNYYFKTKEPNRNYSFYQSVTSATDTKYFFDSNTIFIPTGLFVSDTKPNFVKYGVIGTIIAHELAHGFGIVASTEIFGQPLIWTNRTKEKFLLNAKCLQKNCTKFANRFHQYDMDCDSTLEENFADFVGISLSHEAYNEINEEDYWLPELIYDSNQLFWISYTSKMCAKLDNPTTDQFSHTLPFQRILGSFRNTPYFSEDFDCPSNTFMNPTDKCSLL